MLTFIHCRLHVIKQVHNQVMGGLDTIMIGDLYQAPLVQDSWIFKSKTKLWHENVKCYKLKQVMKQNDINFINILNRF